MQNAIVVGGVYTHYKGGKYRVVAIAQHTETNEKLVVYRPLNGAEQVNVRPLEMFCEMVVRDNVAEPRFALQEDAVALDWEGYQREASKTAMYPNSGTNPIYPTLGLAGEAGEVANVIKKIWRDHEGQVGPEDRRVIAEELGDVLWYVSQLATELHISLADIAARNLQKIHTRYPKS